MLLPGNSACFRASFPARTKFGGRSSIGMTTRSTAISWKSLTRLGPAISASGPEPSFPPGKVTDPVQPPCGSPWSRRVLEPYSQCGTENRPQVEVAARPDACRLARRLSHYNDAWIVLTQHVVSDRFHAACHGGDRECGKENPSAKNLDRNCLGKARNHPGSRRQSNWKGTRAAIGAIIDTAFRSVRVPLRPKGSGHERRFELGYI